MNEACILTEYNLINKKIETIIIMVDKNNGNGSNNFKYFYI